MFGLVASLFGCAHSNCSFPRTSKAGALACGAMTTYVVCLDCGKEFPYDWQKMKITSAKRVARYAAGSGAPR